MIDLELFALVFGGIVAGDLVMAAIRYLKGTL
jgi:hypothetical protein